MTTLNERLNRGEVIIMDGGMGTELERHGVPMSGVAWCGEAVNTHPSAIRQIHEEFIEAGADIIITNTFATAKHVLEPAGLGKQFRELNTRCVTLARDARDAASSGPVYIAGSISTFNPGNNPDYRPTAEQAKANYREQAEVLAEAGVDLIIMEMVLDIEHAGYAAKAIIDTGLPLWLGFSCKTAEDGTSLLFRETHTLAEGLDALLPLKPELAAIMHSDIEDAEPAMKILAERWSGPKGAYPHSGHFEMPHWQFDSVISPAAYAELAQQWVKDGYQVVGGCCGLGPEHIRALKENLPTLIPQITPPQSE